MVTPRTLTIAVSIRLRVRRALKGKAKVLSLDSRT
jgi:hypothetical protein